MAIEPKRRCPRPYCRNYMPCPYHTGQRSERAQEWHGLYDRRWQAYRRMYLAEHPLCVNPFGDHGIKAAECVDHIKPHRGDLALFWSESNLQALCSACHGKKTAQEDGGFGNAPRIQ